MKMNPIAIKHRDSWPDNTETFVLDHKKVKLVVFHGTMFSDDDVDVYGIIEATEIQYWINTRFLRNGDYTVFTNWLKTYFNTISVLNNCSPPTIVWPTKLAGTEYFESSLKGKLIGAFLVFPGCYEKREVKKDVQIIGSSMEFIAKPPHPKTPTPLPPPPDANPESGSGKQPPPAPEQH